MADDLSKFGENRSQMESWIAGWKKYIEEDLALIKKATGKDFKLEPNFASLPSADDYTYAKTYGYDFQNGLAPKICHLKAGDIKILVAAASSGIIRFVYNSKNAPGSVSFENGKMIVAIDLEQGGSQNVGFDLEKALTSWSLNKPASVSGSGTSGSDINPVSALKTALGFVEGIDPDTALLKKVVSKPGFPVNVVLDGTADLSFTNPFSNFLDTDEGNTALHCLMTTYTSKRDESFKILMEAGADCNLKNKFGSTPLNKAAATKAAYYSVDGWRDYNADAIITLASLYKNKLDPNITNNNGDTPLLTALIGSRGLHAEAILKNCKNIKIDFKDSDGDDALAVAVRIGDTYLTELIENYTAQPTTNTGVNSNVKPSPANNNKPTPASPAASSLQADPDAVALLTLMADIMANDMEDRGYSGVGDLRTRAYQLRKKYNLK